MGAWDDASKLSRADAADTFIDMAQEYGWNDNIDLPLAHRASILQGEGVPCSLVQEIADGGEVVEDKILHLRPTDVDRDQGLSGNRGPLHGMVIPPSSHFLAST